APAHAPRWHLSQPVHSRPQCDDGRRGARGRLRAIPPGGSRPQPAVADHHSRGTAQGAARIGGKLGLRGQPPGDRRGLRGVHGALGAPRMGMGRDRLQCHRREEAMRFVRVLATTVALGLPLAAQAQRRIPTTEVVSFGGADSDLYRVTDVVRTDNGHFVVASTRPVAVKLYDRTGRLQRPLGRSGSGPGEYGNSVSLAHWVGDSVLVFSHGTRRWLLFALDGTLVRQWPHE